MAASVAVLAVGVGVTAFQGSGSGDAVVAGDAAAPAASVAALSAEAGPERLAFAGIAPAADARRLRHRLHRRRAALARCARSSARSASATRQQAKQVMTADAPVEIETAGVPATGFLSSEETPARLHHQADPGRRGDRPSWSTGHLRGPGRRRRRGSRDRPGDLGARRQRAAGVGGRRRTATSSCGPSPSACSRSPAVLTPGARPGGNAPDRRIVLARRGYPRRYRHTSVTEKGFS